MLWAATHGRGVFRRFLIGSVTAKVLHDVDCPVLTGAHTQQHADGSATGISNIACAMDFSPQSEQILAAALNRPLNKSSYENAGLPELAAAYAYGIARNHPFVDGNKRTALLTMYTFLGVNGVDFIVPEPDAAAIIFSLAAGEVSEESLARWIRDNWPKA